MSTESAAAAHEFVLGTDAEQQEHEDEMSSMSDSDMDMDHDSNAVSLEPGASGEITWTFTEAGSYVYACHTDGHFAAGMVGSITVAG